MKEGQGWRLLVGLFLATTVIVWAWSTARTGLCELATQTAARELKPVPSCLEFWLNRYQTLLTGILAFGSAAVTVGYLRKQVRQVEETESRQRGRDNYAARAILPLVLSSICEYAERSILTLNEFDPEEHDPSQLDLPDLPPDLIDPLRECVRYSDRPEAKQLADLLHWLQVQSTRQRGLHSDLQSKSATRIIARHDVDKAIIDAADLYALASRLFDYGRRAEEGDKDKPSLKEVTTALAVCGIWDYDRPELRSYLNLTRPNSSAS
jgi:hypothetical protein